MSLVKSHLCFPETMEEMHYSFFDHNLNKNIEIIESVLSDPRSSASQLSEEDRIFLHSFRDCNKVMVKKARKTPISSYEFNYVLRTWIAKVETMGINHFLLIPEIKELLEQEPGISYFEWVHSGMETIIGIFRSLSRLFGY